MAITYASALFIGQIFLSGGYLRRYREGRVKMYRAVFFLVLGVAQGMVTRLGTNTTWRFVQDEEGRVELIDLLGEIPWFEVEDWDVTFYYYSRTSPDPVGTTIEQVGALEGTDFTPNRCTVFIVHGWRNDYTSPVNTILREAVLEKNDCNVFSMDWSSYSTSLFLVARAAVPSLGDLLGRYVQKLGTSKDLKLYGHSMGAHICGIAGEKLGGDVPLIVGMDPALPLFSLDEPSERLDPSDARFVQVIHTCAGFLGFEDPIGHADYYPNGGAAQNGCGVDIIGTCAHSRSYQYFGESIRTGNFLARRCDSYEEYEGRVCDGNEVSFMGGFDVDERASGRYFLDTADELPFALG